MATAPFIDAEIRIIPIADADLSGLESLFDEECAEWLELLKWDYKGASMLIRDVARQHQLAGFVAMSGSAVARVRILRDRRLPLLDWRHLCIQTLARQRPRPANGKRDSRQARARTPAAAD